MSKIPAHAGPQTRKLFVVDDHAVVREGIVSLLSSQPDLTIVGEAVSAAEALSGIDKDPPDLALVDLSLKESSGLELIKDLQVRHPQVHILVLSMRDEAFYAERALRAGARGYVPKDAGREEVLKAVRTVLDGQVYVSNSLATRVIGRMVSGGGTEGHSPMDDLTDRELGVFEMIGMGLATREIAKKMHISTKTVDSHREHLKQKLGLATGADLTKHAIQWMQCQKNM